MDLLKGSGLPQNHHCGSLFLYMPLTGRRAIL